jgi:hypothetical protein
MTSSREEASEKIGLDYLFELENLRGDDTPVQRTAGRKTGPPKGASDPTSDALQAFAAKTLLEKVALLQAGRDEGVLLSEVSERTGLTGDIVISLAQWLEEMKMLEVLSRSTFGDDPVRLTPEALGLVRDEVKLMKRLGLK